MATTATATGDVYDRIYSAVIEQRLVPGTKLTEEKLAAIFSVSRPRVRHALARLHHEGIVDLVPNRGAYVTRPTAEESDDVFEARRIIEPAVLRRLVDRAGASDLTRLADHVDAERRAHLHGHDSDAIRLSGEFHNLVAELAGNRALANATRELSALTCLTILVHHAPTASACRPDDHQEILSRVTERDADGASAAALAHLDRVKDSLVFTSAPIAADLDHIFEAN